MSAVKSSDRPALLTAGAPDIAAANWEKLMQASNEMAVFQHNTLYYDNPELKFINPQNGIYNNVPQFKQDLSTAKRVAVKISQNYLKSGQHSREPRVALDGIEVDEETADEEMPQGIDELTAKDYTCVARVSLGRFCVRTRCVVQPFSYRLSVCRMVRDRFCSGPGQSTNLIHFYVFLTLHKVKLTLFNVGISGAVSGNGSSYDKDKEPESEPAQKKVKKEHAQARIMTTVVGSAIKAAGLGAASQAKDEKLVEAEKLVKEKEAFALDEQAKATKAGSFKQFVECNAVSQELKDQATSAWAALLGLVPAPGRPAL